MRRLIPIFILSLTSAAFGQGDDCGGATPIPGAGSFAFTPSLLTISSFGSGIGCVTPPAHLPDLFFLWTAPSTGMHSFRVDTYPFTNLLRLYDGSGCTATCAFAGMGPRTVAIRSYTAGDQVLVQIAANPTFSGSAALIVESFSQDPSCADFGDDHLENNDTLASAVPLTPGTYLGLYTDSIDPDFYSVTIPPGSYLELDNIDSGTGAPLVFIFDGLGEFLQGGNGPDPTRYVNDSTQSEDIYLEMNAYGYCFYYNVVVRILPIPCFGNMDDHMEPNDACSEAIPITPGSYPSLTAAVDSPDFFSVSVPPQSLLEVQTEQTGSSFGSAFTEIYLLDPTCTLESTGYGQVEFSNTSANSVDITIGVSGIHSHGAPNCSNYNMTVHVAPDPCLTSDDALEDNDSCSAPTPLSAGVHSNLFVTDSDNDFYSIDIPPQSILNIQRQQGSLPRPGIRLFDALCTPLSYNYATNDTINATDSPVSVVFEITMNDGSASDNRCLSYELDVQIRPIPCTIAQDDMFEDNDGCANPTVLGEGTYVGLNAGTLGAGDPDF